jgi:hypothetical protein
MTSETLGSTVDRASVDGGRSPAVEIEVLDQAHLLAAPGRLAELSVVIERVNPVLETHRSTR